MRSLFVIFCWLLSAIVQAQVYNFPVKPGSAQWNNFTTHQQMLDACRIPEQVLSAMSTDDLVKTCLNYPLSIDCFAYDNMEAGIKAVAKQFNGFRELLNRPDHTACLTTALQSLEESTLTRSATDFKKKKNLLLLRSFLALSTVQPKVKGSSLQRSANIRTPKGSLVPDTEVRSEQYSDADKASLRQEYAQAYPEATILGDATTTYNCHAYAWVGPNPGVWMGMSSNPTSIYWTDGSYIETSSREARVIVSYGSDNHSAVITSSPDVFISKWGAHPLMQHAKDYSPYDASNLKYYRWAFLDGYVNTSGFGKRDFMRSSEFSTSAPQYGTVDIYITEPSGPTSWRLLSDPSTVLGFSGNGSSARVYGSNSSSPAEIEVNVTTQYTVVTMKIRIFFTGGIATYTTSLNPEATLLTVKRTPEMISANVSPAVRIVSRTNYRYELYHVLTATLVKSKQNLTSEREEIDISTLPPGIYLLQITENGRSVYHQKFDVRR